MTPSLNELLRRTFMAALAMAAVAAAPTSYATQIKKAEDNSVLCTSYSNMTVGNDGTLAIAGCITGTSAGGPAGAFDFQLNTTLYPNAALTLYPADYTNLLTIVRSGGTTGGVTVNFTRSGGCGPVPLNDSVSFASGVTSVAVDIRTPNNNTTCKATITGVTGDGTATAAPTIGTTMPVATMTVSPTGTAPQVTGGGGGGGGGGTVAGCPAPDPNGKPVSINAFDVIRYTQPPGAIYWAPLPSPSDLQAKLGTGSAARLIFADATNSPSTTTNQVVKEIWISRCPGVFDTNPNDMGYVDQSLTDANHGRCYVSDTMTGDVNTLDWFSAPGADPATTDSTADAVGVCEAYASKGQWYINMRWTYDASTCPWMSSGGCGFTGQWNYSGYSP